MAGYVRQSSFVDGDTITAALFNDEYNQLVNAFHNSTGHSHDGTAASGPVIGLIGDAGETSPNNKVLIDTTNNYIEFYVEVSSNPVQQLYIADGAIIPVTDNDIDLGTSSLEFKDLYLDGTAHIDTLDVDANAGIIGNATVGGTLDVTGNTTLTANLTVNGNTTLGNAASDTVTITADVASDIIPSADSTHTLGDSSNYWSHGYIDAITTTGNVAVGGNLTVTGTTTFNGGTITMGDAATDNVVFGADVDSNIIPDDDDTYDLGSSSQQWRNLFIDGTANIDSLVADTADINGGTVDGAVIGGSTAAAITGTTITGTTITGTSFVIGSADISEAELEILDGATVTTAELNTLDGITSSTAELNILDGVTATAAEINTLDGITSTVAELNILDGVTASATDINLIDGITNGTVIASKAIITDSNKDITGGRNITISGELDAATLDISGDADIDGTLEADAITIGGITLAETISDTVGAMVSSNTESNITVTYEDSDNTLDFALPAALEITTSIGVGGGSTNGVVIEQGGIKIKNGGTQSYVDFYCESSNAHYARLQAPAHSAFGGNVTITLPATTDTLVGRTTTDTLTNKTLTSPTISAPAITGTATFGGSDGVSISQGVVSIKNGGTQSYIDFYCESSNAHYARLQAPAHSAFSGNIVATLPATTGTIALTSSDITGNAATATALATARTIGGTSFDGTSNISVGLADTATALATARTIHGVSFDGTANIDLSEVVQDTVGAMFSSNTETGITATYQDSDGTIDLAIGNVATVSDGSNSTAIASGGTITFAGTSNEIDVAESSGTITYGLPSNVTVSNNLTVSGNLTVTGTTTQTGAIVSDDNFTGLTNANSANSTDFGFFGKYVESSTTKYAGLFYDASTDNTFRLFADTQTEPAVTVNTGATGYAAANLIVNNLTGTLATAAQPNITSLGTLTALTGGTGDFNWDSNTLVVDSSTNRVGIGNASPDVSLDLGSNTDSIHVPVGTTAQRPGSPAAGYFRYNTSLAQFEGYTDAWGAIGGGGGTNTFTHDVFTGNGSTTAYALSQSTESEDNLIVFIDGVFQEQGAYSIATSSGTTTLTFSAAPANGRKIVVYIVAAGVSGSNLNIDTMTGDGSDTTLTLSIAPVNENNTQVFFDGVYQNKSTYSISGTTLTFSTAPPTGVAVEVMTFTQTDINVPVDNTITTAKLVDDAVTSAKLANNIDIAGTFDVTGAATFDSTATFADDIAINNGSPEMYFGTTGNHYNWRLAAQESVDAGFELSVGSQDTNYADDTYSAVMIVKNTGKVGFGSSPTNHTDEIITITTPASGGGQGLAFKRLDSNSDQTVGTLRFSNNSTDDLAKIQTATDGANTSSRIKLQTNTGSGLTDTIVARSNGYVDFTGAADVRVTFGTTGTAGNNDSNWVRGENSDLAFNAASGDHKWEVGGTPVARLDADGLRFGSDTAAANGLDDYEEGTWTVDEKNGQGGTVTTNRANYTKIGRMVFASASVTVGTTTNTNTLNFTLPFASTINGYYLGGGNVSYHQFPAAQSDNLRPNIENAAADVHFLYGDNATNALAVKCNQVSTKRIDFFVQYQVS